MIGTSTTIANRHVISSTIETNTVVGLELPATALDFSLELGEGVNSGAFVCFISINYIICDICHATV